MLGAASSFVLLDDARPGGGQTLYRDPLATIAAFRPEDVAEALMALRRAGEQGHHVAGYLGYEAAPAFLPKLAPRHDGQGPMLWFGVFATAERLVEGAIERLLPDPAGAWAATPEPRISREDYDAAFTHVQALIGAGDIYQANLSFRAGVRIAGDPLALYARLRASSAAGWGAIIRHDCRWLLSLSPELFFRIEDGRIEARPMKGTAHRGRTEAEDQALAQALAGDPKQRAENLMIVDLMRNDLSHIARPGSVAVPALFEVERYPTVQQMVSRVEAETAPGRDAIDALAALFPSGSITGAPKLRAMEVIAEVEADARGIYTGAIGTIAPDGTAAFNVAIRTLALTDGGEEATLGLGSAVVADSQAAAEWAECLAKGAFVTTGGRPFDLIETMRFDALDGLVDLERHLARLKASAAALGFRFDRHAARNELHAATFRHAEDRRVRLRLSPGGAIAIETSPPPPAPEEPVDVALVSLPVAASDFRLRHKTSDRGFYDRARAAAGCFEILFVKDDGQITEGSFTNLFVPRGEGPMLTPPLGAGLLPGILRERLIEEGEAVETPLTAADLSDGFLIGNALRGLISARLVAGGSSARL